MHYLGLGGTSYRVKRGVTPTMLSEAGDQATKLTIGESSPPPLRSLTNLADDQSDFRHVRRDHLPRSGLLCVQYHVVEEEQKGRSTNRYRLGRFRRLWTYLGQA